MKLLSLALLSLTLLTTACGLNQNKAEVKDTFSNNGTTAIGTRDHSFNPTPTNVSNSSYILKAAVKVAGNDALEVLKGEEPSDLFLQAKSALEEENGKAFKDNEEAAFAILALNLADDKEEEEK